MQKLKLSVLISVYFREKAEYLDQALTSVWDDQVFKPSQIVLVKDGPLTAELDSLIELWKEKLPDILFVVDLEKNIGLGPALNAGLNACNEDLVARMDADDLSLPSRFKIQVQFMNDNLDIDISSGYIEEWNEDFTKFLSLRNLPLDHESLVKFAKKRSPINHPACIYRKSTILAVGGYPKLYPEDYFLWVKLMQQGYCFANVPQNLLRMRAGEGMLKRRGYHFLKGEARVYLYMYRTNFIGFFEYLFAITGRAVLRLSPLKIKILVYKYFRL